MNQQLLHITFKTSFIVQVITGIVSILGMFIKLKDKDKVLKDILLIENLVQVVEAIFYVYIILAFTNINKTASKSISADCVFVLSFSKLSN